MIKMRLKRQGRKKSPSYRIVVMDARVKRDGKTIAQLGFYNPITKKTALDFDKITYWWKKGAQPTETVRDIFAKGGIYLSGNDLH
jgi:small subunit ribosomal protein S16